MKKEKKKKEEELRSCACSEDCTCGCQEGKECTCDDTCKCGDTCTCHDVTDKKDAMIEDLKNQVLVAKADLVNYRKRKDEETTMIIKYASQDMILDLLKSIDNFERALESTKEDENNKNLLMGIQMIYKEEVETLKKYGVEEIPSFHEKFDHNLHNAVMVDHDEELEDDIITEVLQKGYKYKDRVIRPTMVKVNKLS